MRRPHAASLIDLAKKGDLAGVKAAIAHGTDVNAKDNKGLTPLLAAAGNGHADVAKLLLDHGATVHGNDYEAAKTAEIKKILLAALPKASLFKTPLVATSRASFRQAINQADGRPLRENDRYWYDKYDSSRLLEPGVLSENGSAASLATERIQAGAGVYCRIRLPNGATVGLGASMVGMELQ